MSDRLIREIPTIGRYARHNENQDYGFRAFLMGSQVSDEELDGKVRQMTDDVWKQIDCLKCGNCCKTLHVLVDDEDISRLSARLKITKPRFIARYIGLVDQFGKHLKSQPCVFLGENNKCTVYDDRPKACRDFPYLHSERFRTRTLTMLSNLSICPIVFNVWQRLKAQIWGEATGKETKPPRRRR